MKKIYIPLASLALVLAASGIASATDSSQSGTTVTITADNVSGASDFTYNTSPNVKIEAVTSATAYAMTSANDKTNTSTGLEYGATSTSTGYAQRTKTTDAGEGPAAPTSATSLPGSNWAWQGGSS